MNPVEFDRDALTDLQNVIMLLAVWSGA